ncbi:hypothetical protein PTQ21_12240 [Paenibacillus marchantiae]|uniref:hypothetical protein n=1 Tax=Paenibacillus marchantiae TaxID=3026433 RepID=UPI00237B2990|nr:hypothetical protein [Paenibacillus marchantiae]WDQ34959.1 hypothetical protein PTQ21_12240 [Paenibacillus marchantiae]
MIDLKYYPMPDHIRKQCNQHFSYTVIVNLFTSRDEIKDYINKNVKIDSDEKLSEDELIRRAADVVDGLVETNAEFKDYDSVQVSGFTIANAYNKEL